MKRKVQRTVRGESLYVDTETELYRKIYVTDWDFFPLQHRGSQRVVWAD